MPINGRMCPPASRRPASPASVHAPRVGAAPRTGRPARTATACHARPMTRVGLVLGGGGVVGQAYHSAVLAVLEHDFGFDARTAEVIVGTSAGSITGTLLRLGVSAEDLAAWTVKAPLSGNDGVLRQMAEATVPELAPLRPWELVRRPL